MFCTLLYVQTHGGDLQTETEHEIEKMSRKTRRKSYHLLVEDIDEGENYMPPTCIAACSFLATTPKIVLAISFISKDIG